tara:strand:+ start:1758 stop:2051 length:294 start_codon:yes stop_codon:yes gene_type:complete
VKRDNRLVAYIQSENGEPFIDVIEVSKKGTSFHYGGSWWMREPVFRSGYCTNDKGERLKINPLSRSYNPYHDYDGIIEIKESAQERYKNWLSGDLKP